jgi:hypothetical protein
MYAIGLAQQLTLISLATVSALRKNVLSPRTITQGYFIPSSCFVFSIHTNTSGASNEVVLGLTFLVRIEETYFDIFFYLIERAILRNLLTLIGSLLFLC